MISPAAALRNVENARAIENGILYMTVIPMFLKFCLYGVSFAIYLPPHFTLHEHRQNPRHHASSLLERCILLLKAHNVSCAQYCSHSSQFS